MNECDAIFNQYHPMVGELGGDFFDVYRPNYSVVDNTPVLVASGLKYRCDPVGYKFSEPAQDGVQYYDVFGPRSILEPGDLLIKTVADGMTPVITIGHFMNQKTLSGLRTSRIGKITNSLAEGSSVYDTVYFEFLNLAYPGSPLNRKLEDSLRIPSTRAVIFNRVNIDKNRMHLVETDSSYERKWMIANYEFSGNFMVLAVENR